MTTYAASQSIRRPASVYVRRRLAVFGMAVAMLVGGFLSFSGAVGAEAPIRTEAHVVAAGDTLWGLASARTEEGDDVRTVMADIIDLNGLESTELVVGQRLRLPAAP